MFAQASPNEYLVIGREGRVTNRGTGIRVFLWPGSTYVRIPATKQEATFEMTHETKDGVPLHFKGIVIYRITQPERIAVNFNFDDANGIEAINLLIRNICLGELRAVVSNMTMQECIEQRKTILTRAVETPLKQVVMAGGEGNGWGIELEMVQVAQVFIIDNELRKQLEAEARNQIRAVSDQSNIRTQEEIRLAQLASERRMQEEKMALEKDGIRQREEIDQAKLQAHRRLEIETQALERETILLAAEKFKVAQEAERQKTETETPVRLMQIEKQRTVLENELALRELENQVRAMEVHRDMLLEQARQELRQQILPLEQTPLLAQALSGIFKGTNLTLYGGESQILSTVLPLIDVIANAIRQKSVLKPERDGGER